MAERIRLACLRSQGSPREGRVFGEGAENPAVAGRGACAPQQLRIPAAMRERDRDIGEEEDEDEERFDRSIVEIVQTHRPVPR